MQLVLLFLTKPIGKETFFEVSFPLSLVEYSSVWFIKSEHSLIQYRKVQSGY